MIPALVSSMVCLCLGMLYPAYASYKAVRTKNVKEYVKWMMYWIVFALFKTMETFTDVFFSFWFPFYYEIKIVLLVYLLSPYTKGSSLLYRQFVHPALVTKEQEIDDILNVAQTRSYNTVMELVQGGAKYITRFVVDSVTNAPCLLGEKMRGQNVQQHQIRAFRRKASTMEGNDMNNYNLLVDDQNLTDVDFEQEIFIDEDLGLESSDDPDYSPLLQVKKTKSRKPSTRMSSRKNNL